MGGAVSASIVTGVMSGCKAEPSGGSHTNVDGNWKPGFLSETQNRTTIEATERIIPKTDTPGAKAVHVNQYIDIMGKDILKPNEKERLSQGLDQLESDAQAAHGKSFANCTAAEMDALLTTTTTSNPEFFTQLKQLTLTGFFTSEVGATQVLKYDKIPGAWEGCIPLEEVGKTWAI